MLLKLFIVLQPDLLTSGYRGVICGMDPMCCESSSWMETAQVDKLSRGPDQPFYQVFRIFLSDKKIQFFPRSSNINFMFLLQTKIYHLIPILNPIHLSEF